jgi:DNA adenine methylase
MDRAEAVLTDALRRAERSLSAPVVANPTVQARIEYIARLNSNRAGIRVVMACSLAKIVHPEVDIRKPYTEIGTPDAYSGRTYDQNYIGQFARTHRLPVNPTTAWLTPALRNISAPLAAPMVIAGTPRKMYEELILLLDEAYTGKVTSEDMLAECIRLLLLLRNERDARIKQLLGELATSNAEMPLSSEEIVDLVRRHMESPNASRLPVLVVAAAYMAAAGRLGEAVKPLLFHNAADSQTGAIGDVEITLIDDHETVTTYEMKDKAVTVEDIDIAVEKLALSNKRPDNYLFVTTALIDVKVLQYAKLQYKTTGGIEFAILDCLQFLRHFLHLFHRLRVDFLAIYQELVLNEPESAVNQPLKEAFLTLRRQSEYDANR